MKIRYPDFKPAAAGSVPAEAAGLPGNVAGSDDGGVFNDEDKSSESGGAAPDVLHDYPGDELPQEDSAEGAVPAEGSSDAGAVRQEGGPGGGPDGDGGGAAEGEAAESSGGEEAESPDGGGSSGEVEGAGRGSPSGGRFVEGAGEGSSPEGPSGSGEPSGTAPSGAGFGAASEEWPESGTGSGLQPESEYESRPVEASDAGSSGAFSGSASEMESSVSEYGGYEIFSSSEAFIPDEGLALIHADLQVIACFLVVFLLIILCQHAYRFFKIFF